MKLSSVHRSLWRSGYVIIALGGVCLSRVCGMVLATRVRASDDRPEDQTDLVNAKCIALMLQAAI